MSEAAAGEPRIEEHALVPLGACDIDLTHDDLTPVIPFDSIDDLRGVLAERRRNGTMTQAEVAEQMEATQGFVSTFERGAAREPFLSTVQRYAAALGLRVRLLLEEHPDAQA